MADHDAEPTQQTQPKGIDPKTGKPYEPVQIPVPKRGVFDRLLARAENTPRRDSEWSDLSLGVVRGTVKEWHEDEGWGVLTSPEAPGEVWAHLTMFGEGYTAVHAGDAVQFEFIAMDQDGFAYRATWGLLGED
jgi:CspA family cold shock protein